MKEKFVYLLSLFVFLVIALLTIKQNDYLYGSQAVTVVPIIVVLILFAQLLFLSLKILKRLDTSLYLLFTSISLAIGLFPYSFVHPVKFLLISFYLTLFISFCHF